MNAAAPSPSPMFPRLLGPMAIVAGAGAVSKALQAVAGVWIARRFGAGPETDAYLLAKGLGMACYLVADSLLYNALVPLWRTGRGESPRFQGFLCAVFLCAMGLAGLAAAALALRPSTILLLVAPDVALETLVSAAPLCRMMGAAVLLAVASSLLKAINAGEGRYVLAGLDPLVLSSAALAALLFTPPSAGVLPLAISVVAAFAVLLTVQAAAARRTLRWVAPHWGHPLLATTAALVAPLVALNLARQTNALVVLRFAAQTGEGAVSWLNYSYSVAQAPVGVIDLVLFSSILPFGAALAAQRGYARLLSLFAMLLRMLLYLLPPAAAWIIFWRLPLVSILFQSAAFSSEDARATAACLAFYAAAITPWCIEALVCRFLFALKRHWLYFLIVVFRVACNVLLCLVWAPIWGAAGVAAAFAFAYGVSAAMGAGAIWVQLKKRGPSPRLIWLFAFPILWILLATGLVVLLGAGAQRLAHPAVSPPFLMGGTGLVCLVIMSAGLFAAMGVWPKGSKGLSKEQST